MADQQEIIYKLDVDTSGTNTEKARASLESLKRKIIETEQAIAKLKTETKGNADAQLAAAGQLSQLETRLRALRVTYNETGRAATGLEGFTQKMGKQFANAIGPIQGLLGALGPLGGSVGQLVGKVDAITNVLGSLNRSSKSTADGVGSLNKFVDGVQGSATKASTGIGALVSGLNPVAVVAAVAGAAIFQFGGELFETAKQIELVERKAQLLYGDAFPAIDAAARANANAIGLTRVEYLNLAVSQQQVFDALGLTKSQTADLTPRLLQLADGLADFSGGQLETAEAANILKSAIQGNVKGLAEFGIPIKRSKGELEQLSAELLKTGQYTKDQADALASVELVFSKVGATIEQFGQGQETLADKTDRINAKFREQKEELANALAPAFNAVTEAAGGFIETLSKAFEGDFDGFQLAAAQFVAITSGNEKGAEAIAKMIAAREKSNASAEEEARSINKVVNAQSVQAASTDQLNEKLKERMHLMSEFVRLGKESVAQKNGLPEDIALIQSELDKRKEQQDAAAKTGLSYEALQAQLTSLQETRKGLGELETEAIKQNDKEIAAVKKRLAVFEQQKKGLSDIEKANERYTKSQQEIALVYAFTTAKIQEAAKQGLTSQSDAQKQLLDLELTIAQQRLNAFEEFAKADGKITDKERENIVALNGELLRAKNTVEEYAKTLDREIKDREAAVKIRVEVEQADIAARIGKEVADAISFGDLSTSLDEVFAASTTKLGADVKDQLKNAALSGEPLDLNLLKDAGATKKEIEAIQTAYDKFRLETERNRVQLIRDEDKRKAEDLRKELDKLIERRQELLSKQAASQTDITIKFSEEDKKELEDTTNKINDLEGKTVTAEVKVAVDDKELKKLEEGIDKIVDGASGKKKTAKKGFESPLAVALGLDETGIQGLYDLARDVTSTISQIYLDAQYQNLRNSLIARETALDAQYESELQSLRDRLDAGLITEAEYDRASIDLEKQTEQKKRDAQRQAFEREKQLKKQALSIELGLQLAKIAVTAAEAGFASPVVYAIYAAIALATYASNLSLINSAQFARKGAIVEAEQGMVAQGPSHEGGGIKGFIGNQHAVTLEGGEAIINKRSTEMFLPQLSAINSYNGWGIPLARYGAVSRTPTPQFSVPQVFARGGQVSLIPEDGTIANRRQLEEAGKRVTHRVVKLNGEPEGRPSVVYLNELDAKTRRQQRTINRVTLGG